MSAAVGLIVVLLIVLIVASFAALSVHDVPPENRSAVLVSTAAVITAIGGLVAILVKLLSGAS